MVFQRCSDIADFRVEHAILDAEAAGMQLLLRIRNNPGALALGARTSDDDSV
jgi:hypothetical protein